MKKWLYWYSYCLNNPLKYSDPSGEFIFTLLAAIFCPPLIPIGIAADIGGGINLGSKLLQGKIHSFGDGVAAYGIGAGGGALAYTTGGAALGAIGTDGFIGGAAAAGTAYTYGTMFTSMGNTAYFGDPMPTAKQFVTGAVISMATGGLFNGLVAAAHLRDFWTGAAKIVPSNWQSPPLRSDIGDGNLSLDGMRPEIKALPDNHSFSVTTSEPLNSYSVEGNTFTPQRPSINGYKPFLADKLDLYHSFPRVLDNQIVQQGSWAYRVSDYVRYNNIGQWFEAPGIIDGVRGVYQIGINESGVIFHRAFIPY